MGTPSRAARASSTSKSGWSRNRPPVWPLTIAPRKPSSLTERSSSSAAAAGSPVGRCAKPAKRSGCSRTAAARRSLAPRASGTASCAGSACTPGVVWLMTWKSMPAASIAAMRFSPRSPRLRSSGDPPSASGFGLPPASAIAGCMKWSSTLITRMGRHPRLGTNMIEQLVEQIEARFPDVQRQLTDPEVIGDRQRYAEAGRQFRALEPAAKLAEEWRRTVDDAAGAEELLAEDGDDPELREMLQASRARQAELEEEIRLAMVERDPNDDKDVIVEIRGGAGGEEAGLWAGDLYRMLTRYAERRGFKTETLSAADGSYTFEVKGDGAYSVFKYEGGTHRVQRVPETESQGRIHTSTATVAVLPEAEEVDVEVDPNDLQIDVYRSSGPGGQSVNTTDSAVRITHKPTGLVVSMQDEKSQLQNRERAMKVLRARLYEMKAAEQQAELAADRRAQVGTGERAEKVRTYNFPQRRVTDHRVDGLTVHNLDAILAGELDEITGALQDAEKRKRLELQAAG